uniref:Uncharacterized protein n=1 Tax=Ditylenchus dipsaci TaxID=166011 RepID=A0A915DL48_9BILA
MPRGNERCLNGKEAQQNYQETLSRIKAITISEDVEEVQEVWECEVRAMLERDAIMKHHFDDIPNIWLLDPRNAYFGGRTGPLVLLAMASKLLKFNGRYCVTLSFCELYHGVPSGHS